VDTQSNIEEFYRAHAEAVYAFLVSLCRDRVWAEDLMQDTFVKATRAMDGYRGGNPRSWLFAIARSVFIDDTRRRRIVVVTSCLVYLLALGLLISAVGSRGSDIWQATAVVVAVTLPASSALISLDRRPSLLPAAWMAALVAGVLVIESAPLWIVVAAVWSFDVRSRPRPARDAGWMAWGRPMLAAAIFVPIIVMGIHADPVCTVTGPDGQVETIDPSGRGLEPEWRLSLGTTETSSGTSAGVVTCRSDTVLWWEALLSMIASGVVLGAAVRWPTSAEMASPPLERNGSSV
jgi:hypothetical protein